MIFPGENKSEMFGVFVCGVGAEGRPGGSKSSVRGVFCPSTTPPSGYRALTWAVSCRAVVCSSPGEAHSEGR